MPTARAQWYEGKESFLIDVPSVIIKRKRWRWSESRLLNMHVRISCRRQVHRSLQDLKMSSIGIHSSKKVWANSSSLCLPGTKRPVQTVKMVIERRYFSVVLELSAIKSSSLERQKPEIHNFTQWLQHWTTSIWLPLGFLSYTLCMYLYKYMYLQGSFWCLLEMVFLFDLTCLAIV